MARHVMSLAKGQTSDDVTVGTAQSAKAIAIDIDLAAALTDGEFEMLLEQIKIYRRKNLAAATA